MSDHSKTAWVSSFLTANQHMFSAVREILSQSTTTKTNQQLYFLKYTSDYKWIIIEFND